ncbi:unnamed protein product [Rangifer tarandus platyrhynchus]|uniref:Uncharacterized protein n=1 Tax=Rangifer tarandus platyrhynchus TaxID=3082113 RepID=A0ABN8YPF4_RANTA|nr:unnamed protein product [Rangifer tarandus platyrhynchus]
MLLERKNRSPSPAAPSQPAFLLRGSFPHQSSRPQLLATPQDQEEPLCGGLRENFCPEKGQRWDEGPRWPFAALVVGDASPGEAWIRKEAMCWAPEPRRPRGRQLHVTAPALTRGAPAAEGGGDTAAPTGRVLLRALRDPQAQPREQSVRVLGHMSSRHRVSSLPHSFVLSMRCKFQAGRHLRAQWQPLGSVPTRQEQMELRFRKGNELMKIRISGGTTKYFLGR